MRRPMPMMQYLVGHLGMPHPAFYTSLEKEFKNMYAIEMGDFHTGIAKDVLKSQTGFALKLVTGGKHPETVEQLIEACFKVEDAYNKQYKTRADAAEEERKKKEEERYQRDQARQAKEQEERRIAEAKDWAEYVKKNPIRRWDQRDGGDVPAILLHGPGPHGGVSMVIPRNTKLVEVLKVAAAQGLLGYGVKYTEEEFRCARKAPGEDGFTSVTDQVIVTPWVEYRVEKREAKPAETSVKVKKAIKMQGNKILSHHEDK